MPIAMEGDHLLPAGRETVWRLLNDPEVLRACVPGCEELTQTSPTSYDAVARIKIGPVKARFRGKVRLEDIDAPAGCRIVGEGDGGVSGFASGGAAVRLTEEGAQTRLTYEAEANVGGKLAQIGGRLIGGAAKKLSDQFFAAFAEQVAQRAEA